MDAQIYNLAATRSKRDTAITMARIYPMQMASDGLALLLTAQSSWAKYALAMASFHQAIWFNASSPASKPATNSDVVRY